MIPAPVPVFPVAAILVAVAGVFFYAAFLAGRGTARSDRGTKAWRRTLMTAAVAALLGIVSSTLLVNILATHDRNYNVAIWSLLAKEYGVQSAIAEQGFVGGVPFAAIVNGESVECTVTLPQSVVCGGETLHARGS
ncbi:hypothetical protein IV500_05475 [Paeniglutamicibacter antarcticus]|uniref:Uncharacterized protein n=1 Tax=Arthrobacter terrae TaxID=2935737 RepID=A0A931CPZ1_9MICC|nr:hypothetical protein [Arthrobacter terrae]MBG0738871.1 hypothetical protein [Arthrobacter terrae]